MHPHRWNEDVTGFLLRIAASGILPPFWFRRPLPKDSDRRAVDGQPTVEIVSHCWRYSRMLAYQLSSFVNHPPTKLSAIVTVFYSEEDLETKELLEFFGRLDIPSVEWNWNPLPKEKLFRRGIGRNMAALSTRADWIWMTDCDIIFHKDCLDSLSEQLQGRKESLLYPRQERITEMLEETSLILQRGRNPEVVEIDTKDFTVRDCERAYGPFQIIHGDVARAIGYCKDLTLYQTPSAHWCKCYEDRAFRWLVGSQGEPIDVKGVYQIRHLDKGRYRKDSRWSKLRRRIRLLRKG